MTLFISNRKLQELQVQALASLYFGKIQPADLGHRGAVGSSLNFTSSDQDYPNPKDLRIGFAHQNPLDGKCLLSRRLTLIYFR